MTARGRGGNAMGSDWDPMRSEYETSMYETNDEEGSSSGQLDHCRLYITNIPKALNEDGLRASFAKYGTLSEVHVSGDPTKRYALVKFETPGEAKLAMMKLNHTEPLKMNIAIAYKQRQNNHQGSARKKKQPNKNSERLSNRQQETSRDLDFSNDNVSVTSSRQRARPDMSNGDDENYLRELDDMEELDPDLDLELERLRLQAAQLLYKQRLRDVKLAERRTMSGGIGSRCVMADGKILVRTTAMNDDRDNEGEIAGAGDSCLTPPALQHAASRACVQCGARADAFCARCGVTPYCGVGCQRRDWARRHSAVCHNLASEIPPAAPLRRPRSSIADDARYDKRPQQPAKGDQKPYYNNKNNEKPYNKANNSRNQPGRRPPLRHETGPDQEENWPAPTTEPKPKPQPAAAVTSPRQPPGKAAYPKPSPPAAESNAAARAAPPRANVEPVHVEPKKPAVVETPLIPAKCLLDLLDVGESLLLEVQALAADCASDVAGFVCLSLHHDHQESYMALCEDFLAACEEDKQEFRPTPGDAFSVLDPADSSWYRARLLSPDKAALLDAARLLDTKGASCKRLPPKYAALPEFCCVLSAAGVQLGDRVKCTIKSRASDGRCAVAVYDADTEAGRPGGHLARWRPRTVAAPAATVAEEAAPVQEKVAGESRAFTVVAKEAVPAFEEVAPVQEKVAGLEPCPIGSFLKWKRRAAPPSKPVYKEVGVPSKKAENLAANRSTNQVHVPSTAPAPGTATVAAPTAAAPTAAAPTATASTAAAPAKPIPEVPRPPLHHKSEVALVDATPERLVLRAADSATERLADLLEQDVALYGLTAEPLAEPPTAGETVVAKFTDGIHYRALCRRTNVRADKYLLEYIEYGNSEVSCLEKLYPCPESLDLRARPALTSAAILPEMPSAPPPQALEYLETLKGQTAILTLPSGEATAPSGSEVILTLTKNRDNVNKKLQELCTPEWKKVQDSGADVVSTEVLMLSDVEYLPLPESGCQLQLLDSSTLAVGAVSAYPTARQDHALKVLGTLAERMAEYCESELASAPYLPRIEELCIAKFPQDGQWYRAVLCELPEGAGSPTATVAYLDFGNVCVVPVSHLRKMQREFLTDTPALATSLEIRDFPAAPSQAALRAARQYLKIDADGTGGELHAAKCEMSVSGFYVVDAPELLAAMAGL